MFKQVNGVKVRLSTTEIAEMKKFEKAWDSKKNERELNKVRAKRIPLLLEADYEINKLFDSGGDTTDWKKYRQQLRDITKSADPFKITFPEKPL